ncbi:hypothetical protein HFO17_12400 [Rhizobium laguerreae]|nr:hypothetical protein [Rhizobium laguerreae]MBY3235337.1 hypothetical protein [Rhizobium laguerreae]
MTEISNRATTKLTDLPPITNDGDDIRPSARHMRTLPWLPAIRRVIRGFGL